MLNPRILMFGSMPGCETSIECFTSSETPSPADLEQDVAREGIFDCIVVVPVYARPDSPGTRDFGIDHSAQVVLGDVPEEMSLSAFERTLAEYNGTDRRGTPVVNFDDVSAEMYTE